MSDSIHPKYGYVVGAFFGSIWHSVALFSNFRDAQKERRKYQGLTGAKKSIFKVRKVVITAHFVGESK